MVQSVFGDVEMRWFVVTPVSQTTLALLPCSMTCHAGWMPTFPSRSRPLSWKFSSKCCARMMLDYGPQTLMFGVVVQGDWLEVLGCGVVEQQIMINSGQGKNKAVLWSRHSSQLRNRRQDRMGIWFGTRATSNGPFRVQQTPSPQVIWRSLTVSVAVSPTSDCFGQTTNVLSRSLR